MENKKVDTQLTSECKRATKVGFVGMQVATPQAEEPEILLDSGSTISLFKDSSYLKETWMTDSRLVMETNAGRKVIDQKGMIPGYGEVWYDNQVVSNLFSLSDVIKKGMRVHFDSNIANEFIVTTQEGRTIRFTEDE